MQWKLAMHFKFRFEEARWECSRDPAVGLSGTRFENLLGVMISNESPKIFCLSKDCATFQLNMIHAFRFRKSQMNA